MTSSFEPCSFGQWWRRPSSLHHQAKRCWLRYGTLAETRSPLKQPHGMFGNLNQTKHFGSREHSFCLVENEHRGKQQKCFQYLGTRVIFSSQKFVRSQAFVFPTGWQGFPTFEAQRKRGSHAATTRSSGARSESTACMLKPPTCLLRLQDILALCCNTHTHFIQTRFMNRFHTHAHFRIPSQEMVKLISSHTLPSRDSRK